MQLEIRFCPFCGEQPELLVAPCQSGEWHAVYCKTCGGGQADDSYDLAAVIAAWNRRAPGPVTGIDTLIANTVRRVAEYDDRTSPDGWPEALLITPDELAHELREFASGLFAPGPDAAGLLAALEATLIFHSGGEWDAEKSARWKELTENRDATTKGLCDMHRAAIAKFKGETT